MELKKAKRIEQLRTGKRIHSWRALSEVICKEFTDEPQNLAGNQMHGIDLCREAMITLSGVKTIREVPTEVRDKWDT